MHEHSFFQKLLLTIVAAFFAAGLIWIYQHVVVGASHAIDLRDVPASHASR